MYNNKAILAPYWTEDSASCITITLSRKQLKRAHLIDGRELSNVSYRDTFLSELHGANRANISIHGSILVGPLAK